MIHELRADNYANNLWKYIIDTICGAKWYDTLQRNNNENMLIIEAAIIRIMEKRNGRKSDQQI